MKRTNLFNRTPVAAGPSWSESVQRAIAAWEPARILALFRMPRAKQEMSNGFRIGDTSDLTFALYCLHDTVPNGLKAMRMVLEHIPTITLADCCHFERGDGKLTVSSDMVLHEEALRISRPNLEAMLLALEFEPHHECMSGPLSRFDGNSLHYEALAMLVNGMPGLDKQSLASICKELLDRKAPICSSRKPVQDYKAADLLFGSNWDQYAAPEVVEGVIHYYVASREIDLDVRTARKGSRPVELAIMSGNGRAAALAIDLGCDLSPDTVRGTPDVLSFARSLAFNDSTGHMVPLVTAAVMRRRLKDGSATVSANASGAGATRRRAGL